MSKNEIGVRIDTEVDIATAVFSAKRPAYGIELPDAGLVLHIAEDGTLVEIEVFAISKPIDRTPGDTKTDSESLIALGRLSGHRMTGSNNTMIGWLAQGGEA